jgi:hypothetical protein
MTKAIALFLLALVCATAQTTAITVVRAGVTVPAANPPKGTITVLFEPAPSTVPVAVMMTSKGVDLNATALTPAFGVAPASAKTFVFDHDSLPANHSIKEVCFSAPGLIFTPACKSIEGDPVVDVSNAVAIMQKVAKPQDKKNIFASGLVTTASTGTTGAMDVNLNSTSLGIDNLTGFLQIKRATADTADPKNFEAGIGYTSAIPLTSLTESTVAALLTDLAAKTEGTASKFGVNNFVGEFTASLQSVVFRVGSGGRAKFRFLGGMEGGSNQSKGDIPTGRIFDPLRNVDWIARGKVGIQGSLLYKNDRKILLPFQSVELHAAGVSRHLWFDELQYSADSDKVDKVTKGWRPWAQVDLKLMLVENNLGRYGLKLTFQNGSLPPVFARTRTFQFGFVFEAKDGTEK